jgi:hypothetical protein
VFSFRSDYYITCISSIGGVNRLPVHPHMNKKTNNNA